jgi:N-acetyl-alpha-D-muramate 1-phosphate uridylyltransferase
VTEPIAALVLAAGQGRRLRPLTLLRPKPLCPLAETTFLDLALERVAAVVPQGAVAVNAHHLANQVVAHVGDRAHLSVEQPVALGTAGAVGALRGWLDGRDVLIANGDVCFAAAPDLAGFLAGWDRVRPRLLVVRDAAHPDFDGQWRFAGVSLLPAAAAASLAAEPSGLYEVIWRNTGLDLVPMEVGYVDAADPSSYLRANLMRSGGASVVGAGATVEGSIERCVIWPGGSVLAGEHLVEVVRARGVGGEPLTVAAPQQRRPDAAC